MKAQTTLLLSSLQSMQQRYQPMIDKALREALDRVHSASGNAELDAYYGQMRYHLGWVDISLAPAKGNAGKMFRSMLLLLAYEAAGAWGLACPAHGDVTHLRRALPTAVAIELAHNASLIHDDIEDGDTQRRHRPTLWQHWGVPQAINAGDGMFALSRQSQTKGVDHGTNCNPRHLLPVPIVDQSASGTGARAYPGLDQTFSSDSGRGRSELLSSD